MRVVGIIAEYNPLHNGHIYHLEEARRQTGAAYCVVVMSGSFVQRGEPACTDKLTRAEWAVKAGADVVIELPSVYAVSSAERFALGGIRTLMGTGVVTDLAFGCEEPDLNTLYQLCDIIITEPPLYKKALHFNLKQGMSYPRARFEALSGYGVPPEMLEAIAKPNNILAVEYIRALRMYAPEISPLPVPRVGCGYNDNELTGQFSSATAIRRALLEGNRSVLAAMPSFVGGPILYDASFPVTMDMLSDMLLYAIRTKSPEALGEVPDIGEGLENVFADAARKASSISEFLELVKTKRYTLARIKRAAVNCLLGVTSEQVHETVRREDGVYLHVLAFANGARPLLSMMAKAAKAPLLLRYADIAKQNPIVRRNLATDALSTDLISFALKSDLRRDYQAPVIVQ